MKQLLKIVFICCAFVLNSAYAVEIPRQVAKDYQAGLQGNAGANARAIEQLNALIEQNPADPLVAAMLGSSETARARYVDQPWKKIRFSEKGLARLDKALQLLLEEHAEAAPGQLSVWDRVTTAAACTFVALPPMFQRFDQGYEMLQRLIASDSFTGAAGYQKIPVYHCAARAASGAGDEAKARTYQSEIEQLQMQLKEGQ